MRKEELINLKKELEQARDEEVKRKKNIWYKPVEVSDLNGVEFYPKNLYTIEEECDSKRTVDNFEKMIEFYIKTLVENGVDFDKIIINLPFTVFVDSNIYETAMEDAESELLDEYYFPKDVPILDEYVGVYLLDCTIYNNEEKVTVYGLIRTMEEEFKECYTSMNIVKYQEFMEGIRKLGYKFSELGDFEDLKASLYDNRLASASETIEFKPVQKKKTINKC